MLEFLRRIFRSLFGDSATQPAPQPEAARAEQPQTSGMAKPETEAAAQPAHPGSGLLLQRYSASSHDTLGRLYLDGEQVAYTLEGPPEDPQRLAAGTYPLVLRQEGGKHATYRFRFGDYHQGLMAIGETGRAYFPLLHMGNTADHLDGSIVLGKSVHREDEPQSPREVWHSEDAYRKVYDLLLPKLNNGQPLKLTIEPDK